MRKVDVTRLEAFEMKVWRWMEKISWTEHISNEVLKLVEEERSLLTIIRTRQRDWMGHIMTVKSRVFYCQSIQIMTTTMKQYKQFGDKRRAQKGTMFPLARDTKIVNKCGKKQYTSSYISLN